MVKPFKIFLILVLLIVLLIIPSFIIPKEGIKIGNYHFTYPDYTYFLSLLNNKTENPTLAPQIAFLEKIIDSTDLAEFQVDSTFIKTDSIPKSDSTVVSDSLTPEIFNVEWLRSKIVKLEYPDSTRSALDKFFEVLRSGECNKRLVRIMHFGDSQIEGDRITSFIRSKFQNQFGGSGLGLMHIEPNGYQQLSVSQNVSSNWEKITLLDKDHNQQSNLRYSIFGGFSTFNPQSGIFSTSKEDEAWVEIKRSGSKKSTVRNFNRFRLLYGFNNPFLLELRVQGQPMDGELINNSATINHVSYDIPLSINSFELYFKAEQSPLVFGISLESDKGIVVDNIPLRGSSGVDFSKSDPQFIKDVLTLLNTKLVILQFGVNVVPNVVNSYKYYENQLVKQLKLLQTSKPDASFILIGVSDVSKKDGINFISSPNIEKIRNAQRNAAFRAGIPFWDCYKAMGGKNSMSAWAFADPPLANKDFIHFTYRGSKLIAEMFYAALMTDYKLYLDSFTDYQSNIELRKNKTQLH